MAPKRLQKTIQNEKKSPKVAKEAKKSTGM